MFIAQATSLGLIADTAPLIDSDRVTHFPDKGEAITLNKICLEFK